MNLHEYQAKQLLTDYQVPVPSSEAVDSVAEALAAAKRLGGKRWVVKAQVHAGGRGKAGGVRLVSSEEEVFSLVYTVLGRTKMLSYFGEKLAVGLDHFINFFPKNLNNILSGELATFAGISIAV